MLLIMMKKAKENEGWSCLTKADKDAKEKTYFFENIHFISLHFKNALFLCL